MPMAAPAVLHGLLRAEHPDLRQQAWERFLAEHSRLLLFVARSYGGDYDAVMDRYARLLDHLSRDDFRRLRAFAEDGRSSFTSWLVIVSRNICLDEHRHRYGRARGRGQPDAGRRRLVDLVASAIEPEMVVDDGPDAAAALEHGEISSVVNAALATLAPADQTLLRLRFDDDLPAAEIAHLLGYPTRFHAYRHIDRALRQLRAALAERGLGRGDL